MTIIKRGIAKIIGIRLVLSNGTFNRLGGRVGASIPAPIQIPPSSNVTYGLRFDGWYHSRCEPSHKRVEFLNRNYLRSFPDGTVIAGPENVLIHGFRQGPRGTSGRYTLEGDAISFSILLNGELVGQYEGRRDGERLHLSRYCREGWASSRDVDVYKFRPLGMD